MTRAAIGRAFVLVAVTAAGTWWATRPNPPAAPDRLALSIALPAGHAFADAALSPDGSALVYTAVAGGQARLFLRRLDRFEIRPLAGTAHAAQPFFAPDGGRVGFFADGWLKWTALEDGVPVPVLRVGGRPAGASWGPNDEIVFAPLGGRGLQLVTLESGGAAPPTALTTLDPDGGELAHGWPHFLPDGRSLLFTVARRDRDPHLAWLSRAETDFAFLGPADGAGFYIDSGQIVLARRGEIFVLPVETAGREVAGPRVPLQDGVAGTASGYDRLGRSSLIAARSGRLAFVDVAAAPATNQLVWVDRAGTAVEVDGVIAVHQTPRVAPDGSRIAVAVRGGPFRRDLWIVDPATRTRRQLTAESGDNHSPLWSPDGRIAFASNREGPQQIYRTTTGSPAAVETLVRGDGRTPGSWAPRGQLFFHEAGPDRARDIWRWQAGPAPDGAAVRIVATPANERAPALSPDGQRLAYVSDTADGDQVYVSRPPDAPGRRVSLAGGTEPVWARDGSQLYFRSGRTLFTAAVDGGTGTLGRPRRLFAGAFVTDPGGDVAAYDTSPDGSRFLMLQPAARPAALSVIDHWAVRRDRADE